MRRSTPQKITWSFLSKAFIPIPGNPSLSLGMMGASATGSETTQYDGYVGNDTVF
jgi:hypothetical protein